MSSYKQISKNIQEVVIDNPKKTGDLTWVDISDAGKKEIEFLRKRYNFSLSHLQASSAKTKSQRPIIEKGSDYIFLILHFPVFENTKIVSGEINFFVGKDYIVTIHNNNIKALNQFFNLYKKDLFSFLSFEYEAASVLLYEILDKLILDCYPLLDHNSISLYRVEELIYSQQSQQAVGQILALRRDIINTRKILQNHKNIIKKLIHNDTGLTMDSKIKKLYIEMLDHTKRIWENLENQKEMIEVLNSTNESHLNYQISDIMKTLTIITVIVYPLNLIASVFGMNVVESMPFMGARHGFWIVIAIMSTASLCMLLFFERKKWL